MNGRGRDLGLQLGVSGEAGWIFGAATSSFMGTLAGEGSKSRWNRDVDLDGNWE